MPPASPATHVLELGREDSLSATRDFRAWDSGQSSPTGRLGMAGGEPRDPVKIRIPGQALQADPASTFSFDRLPTAARNHPGHGVTPGEWGAGAGNRTI